MRNAFNIVSQYQSDCARKYAEAIEQLAKDSGVTVENAHRVTRAISHDYSHEQLFFDDKLIAELRQGMRENGSGGMEWFVQGRNIAMVGDLAKTEPKLPQFLMSIR